MKGLKLTRGVCCLLPLSISDFPETSTFLNKETLLLEDPGPELLALDSKLFGVCGVSKSRSFLKVLCGGVSGQSGIGELDPPSSGDPGRQGDPPNSREVFRGDGEQLANITLLGDCR